jgi:lipoprotein-anchoring transpeptidase ErfK/SrfK
MQRVILSALALSAFALSAHAQTAPLSNDSSSYTIPTSRLSEDRLYDAGVRREVAARQQSQYVQPVRVAAPRSARYASAGHSNLGGGFIEFLFNGGGSSEQRSMPQPMPQVQSPPDGGLASQPLLHQAYAPAAAQAVRPPMDPKFLPQMVAYNGPEQPGTILINTQERFLYLVEEGGKAKRYGIGVGRPGFAWAGVHKVSAKKEWPDWIPPEEMLKRRPDLPRFMPGGPDNPLGARALYLGSTLYRIHGSNEPWTIGHAVSSGCIRMRNADVMDLYNRVPVGTKVVVI